MQESFQKTIPLKEEGKNQPEITGILRRGIMFWLVQLELL